MKTKNTELKIIFVLIILFFAVFLFFPAIKLALKSFECDGGFGFGNYVNVITEKNFLTALLNSINISIVSALLSTFIAFMMAYTINYTNANKYIKNIIKAVAVLPMFLPTITYGFAIIYSFGKQGLVTKILGRQLFDIYGYKGLLIGYLIYTLPISFMLINNTILYLDKKFMIVSRVMGDNKLNTLWITILRPLVGTFTCSVIQCFFLCFTDFGIPASVGGKFNVVASVLYEEMLGALPNFNNGAVVAIIMLLPSIISIIGLTIIEKYNIRYNKISTIELTKSKTRDILCSIFSLAVAFSIIIVFSVIAFIPFVKGWPYDITFTLDNVKNVFSDSNLVGVYENSLIVALLTAVVGTIIAYGATLITARSNLDERIKKVLETASVVTNTIPGMVLGIAFLLAFKGGPLHNTFAIIILCNIVHFFSTPYLMMKNSLSKMNRSWETTARLMGDNWMKTIIRVVTPNAFTTLLEVFGYYFVNAMVTVSAVIFIAGARTMVITTKIKELQHFAKFNEIFVLSLLILVTNLLAKIIFNYLANRRKSSNEN